MTTSCEKIRILEANQEALIYWLLRAHRSGHREGWEDSPSVRETMDGIHSVLCNYETDPNDNPQADRMLKVSARYPPLESGEARSFLGHLDALGLRDRRNPCA